VAGTYVRMSNASTDYGRKAIVVLNVDGEEHSVWLFETALVSKFKDELAERPTGISLSASTSRLGAAPRRSKAPTAAVTGRTR
jgi:hypothetical protein